MFVGARSSFGFGVTRTVSNSPHNEGPLQTQLETNVSNFPTPTIDWDSRWLKDMLRLRYAAISEAVTPYSLQPPRATAWSRAQAARNYCAQTGAHLASDGTFLLVFCTILLPALHCPLVLGYYPGRHVDPSWGRGLLATTLKTLHSLRQRDN